jgi:hypothetical protein
MTDWGGMPPYAPLQIEWNPHSGAPPRVISGIPIAVVVVDGRMLDKYKERFDLIAVVFHIINSEPFMDKQGICKSKIVKIRPENLHIKIDFNDQYLTELEMGMNGENYRLLAVPIGMKPEDFGTLNEAEEKGAQIIDLGATAGPPSPMQVNENHPAH